MRRLTGRVCTNSWGGIEAAGVYNFLLIGLPLVPAAWCAPTTACRPALLAVHGGTATVVQRVGCRHGRVRVLVAAQRPRNGRSAVCSPLVLLQMAWSTSARRFLKHTLSHLRESGKRFQRCTVQYSGLALAL